MRIIAILLLFPSLIFSSAAIAFAAGDVTIDAKVTGGIVILTAKTDGKTVVWIIPDSLTQPVPSDMFKDAKVCVCQGKPGTYKVLAISAIADKPLYGDVLFTLSGAEPKPIIPDPPAPVDDLAARLKALYLADSSPAKRGQLVNLIGIYAAMAEHAEKDLAIVTSQQLLEVLNKVKTGMLMEGVLVELRRACTTEVQLAVGPPNAMPFDRAKVSAMFRRLVKAMPVPE